MKINDSVKVKLGVEDPDIEGNDLSGWQGRIVEIDAKNKLVTVAWDSVTLKNYSLELLMQTWDNEFTLMVLGDDDLEPCEPRDTEAEAAKMQEWIMNWADFLSLFDTNATIYAEIFDKVNLTDEMQMYQIWHKHIEEALNEPIEAELIDESFGDIREGCKLVIKELDEFIDDKYGILANCKTPKKKALLPLCCCEPLEKDEDTEAEMLIRDYIVWFANR
jgi:hypothetical protein